MTSVRLPKEIEQKLESMARRRQKSKTELIRMALERFFDQEESRKDSYELGEPFFGLYGSGDGTLSTTYKTRLKEKIDAKLRAH
ncbi:MAG: ribbon-helix-helix protein, CopG family [Spirochaetaceae bacterium]|nr:MAG: ribbon-helix-helix protein, CopG family [Spirochaetaceae bacterium]